MVWSDKYLCAREVGYDWLRLDPELLVVIEKNPTVVTERYKCVCKSAVMTQSN